MDVGADLMETTSFESWLSFAFDRPPDPPGEFWWWDTDDEDTINWTGFPDVLQSYLVRLFREPDVIFSRYSRDQIGRGLWFLASDYRPAYLSTLLHDPVPIAARVECIESMYDLFVKGFAPHCSDQPAYCRNDKNEVDMTCFMWWDINYLYDMPERLIPEVEDAVLNVMSRLLRVPSVSCQESALHGLHHWRDLYPEGVVQTIDTALSQGILDPRLHNFAETAARGVMP